MKSILTATLLVIAAITMWVLLHVGALKSVELERKEVGPIRVVFKHHLGAYHKIEPVIEEVETWARGNGESCTESFGEYIDNPDTTDEDRLNANVGCIVQNNWNVKPLLPGFEFREIPKRLYVAASFQGAPSIGPLKVYPKAETYIKEQRLTADGPVIETYQTEAGEAVITRYYFPVKTTP